MHRHLQSSAESTTFLVTLYLRKHEGYQTSRIYVFLFLKLQHSCEIMVKKTRLNKHNLYSVTVNNTIIFPLNHHSQIFSRFYIKIGMHQALMEIKMGDCIQRFMWICKSFCCKLIYFSFIA